MEPLNYIDQCPLSTLTAWSETHIRAIFEAATDDDCIDAIEHTFIPNLSATINGNPVSCESIKQLVLTMRAGSKRGLTVHWEKAAETTRNPKSNRDGHFSGSYIIKGIRKQEPGHAAPMEYERHKTVDVIIKSQSSDLRFDSRRIVDLKFVAVDVAVANRRPLL